MQGLSGFRKLGSDVEKAGIATVGIGLVMETRLPIPYMCPKWSIADTWKELLILMDLIPTLLKP